MVNINRGRDIDAMEELFGFLVVVCMFTANMASSSIMEVNYDIINPNVTSEKMATSYVRIGT